MKKIIGSLGLAAVLAFGASVPAQANVQRGVEGNGYYTGQLLNGSQLLVEWGCTATSFGFVASATTIPNGTCVLKSNGTIVDRTGASAPGNFVATVLRTKVVPLAPVQVCWQAEAFELLTGQRYVDTTGTNCTTINTAFAGV